MASVAHMKPKRTTEYEDSSYTFFAGRVSETVHELSCTVNIHDMLDACLLYGSSKVDLASTSATIRFNQGDNVLVMELQRDVNIWTQVHMSTVDMSTHEVTEAMRESQLDDQFLPPAALSTRYESRFASCRSGGVMACKLQGTVLARMLEDVTEHAEAGECVTLDMRPDTTMMGDYTVPDGTIVSDTVFKLSIGEANSQPTACVACELPKSSLAWDNTPRYDPAPEENEQSKLLPPGVVHRYHARLLAHMLRALSQLESDDLVLLRINAVGMLSVWMSSTNGSMNAQAGAGGGQYVQRTANYVQFFMMPAEDMSDTWARPAAAQDGGEHGSGTGTGGEGVEEPMDRHAQAYREMTGVQGQDEYTADRDAGGYSSSGYPQGSPSDSQDMKLVRVQPGVASAAILAASRSAAGARSVLPR